MYLPDIPDFKLGDTGVTRIMLGEEQVWPYIPRIPLIDGQRYIIYARDSSLSTYDGWTCQSLFAAGGMTLMSIAGTSGGSVSDTYYWAGGMLVVTAVTYGSGSYLTWIWEGQEGYGTQYYVGLGHTSSGNTQLPILKATTAITDAELFVMGEDSHLLSISHFDDYIPIQLYASVALPGHDTATARMGIPDTVNKDPNYREYIARILKYSGNAKNDGTANPLPY